MKRKIIIGFGIIILLFVVLKMREFFITNKIYSSVEYLKNAHNRYYLVSTKRTDGLKIDTSVYLNENFIKINVNNSILGNYSEWKNLHSGETNIYNVSNKKRFESEIVIQEDTLIGLPNFIANMHKNNGVKISQLLKVYYIIPTTYDNKPCYKISTTSEIIIIDKKTYLPLYSLVKTVNSNKENDITENTYKFEINTVTYEDVSLPNFEEYEKVNNN